MTTPGTRSARAVSLVDIYPTLAELTGIAAPENLDGVSLKPLLEDPDMAWDRSALSTNEFGNHAVRSERYRYIRYYNGNEELYDHERDPGEWANLATNPAYDEIKVELAKWMPVSEAEDALFLK